MAKRQHNLSGAGGVSDPARGLLRSANHVLQSVPLDGARRSGRAFVHCQDPPTTLLLPGGKPRSKSLSPDTAFALRLALAKPVQQCTGPIARPATRFLTTPPVCRLSDEPSKYGADPRQVTPRWSPAATRPGNRGQNHPLAPSNSHPSGRQSPKVHNAQVRPLASASLIAPSPVGAALPQPFGGFGLNHRFRTAARRA